MQIRIKMEPGCENLIPEKKNKTDAGFDLKAANAAIITPGETLLVSAGFRIELQPGWEAQVRSRSGLALKQSVQVLNAPGTIDADYRGVVGVILHNAGDEDFHVNRGDRIAQMVVKEVPDVQLVVTTDELTITQRGDGGFGSTGKS